MKKSIVMFCAICIVGLLVSESHAFSRSGRINGIFSYQNLKLQETASGCVLTGKIRNDSKRSQTGVNVTFRAYDNQDKYMGEHTLRVSPLNPGSAYTFEENIAGCTLERRPSYFLFKTQ
jgi:hypothetical protein